MEDSGALRRIVTRYLRDAGHNVTGFDNGIVSSDADMLGHADLLITDLSMPDVDGRQAVRNIRNVRPNLPVIVITGEELFDDPVVKLADGFLQKPFDEGALLEIIDRILGESSKSILDSVNGDESQFEKTDVEDWPSTRSNAMELTRPAAFCSPAPTESWLSRLKDRLFKVFTRN